MLPHLFAILGFAAMCGLWVVLQKKTRAPTGACSSCSCGAGRGDGAGEADGDGHCRRTARTGPDAGTA
ncbi:MAG: hypothetical protein JNN13_13175 [Planctomycetes bacterium]|nr:hypothetical protein [Planctomycetota bacterium]